MDKTGQLPFKDKVWILPENIGKPGYLEDAESGKVLCPKISGLEEAILKNKARARAGTRTSTSTSLPSDSQKWIKGQPDKFGWFRITHAASGKFLTSSTLLKSQLRTLMSNKKEKKTS